ncbi:hypothetical protein LEP1GSC034_3929 [Leptospira interrogans str. 2003000735]|uniref:Uncharacterized protein n=1 Tax=Leptospira interrogans str. 2002000626 TaxID=996803 RepID=A0A829D9N6_LEPIR|nr:hypothetical protein LEP1GSC027_4361 [Leptospira interrogans str. 2002000624]EKQ37984.1 hypothetical protein LEP1GSC025_4311 [Leptospira interrogans str. 2002000621]EKQ49068.1 hypothetical protein LEP1GSC026_4191 [Leptospira interrogans str. 2002000623]EMJ69474.1 hypothetical protein LEP1GSC033_2780 [Leptospira interrogans str. 2002000632]EMJ72219.1 hypothetical protein LEP1GSC034_3929 [Leptospira interrogans str. 2003000735]EMJ80060.1 hypothetical protein LEP1GSC032_1572 [Leptospira interr
MVVPTFKESIYKIQIPTFFRTMSSLRRIHVKNKEFVPKPSNVGTKTKI